MPEKPRPFTVWEGDRAGEAYGRGYRTRFAAIVAAWWASLYNGRDVWIEREIPTVVSTSLVVRGPDG